MKKLTPPLPFLRPPVHFAQWAHMHRFLSVRLSVWTGPKFISQKVLELGLWNFPWGTLLSVTLRTTLIRWTHTKNSIRNETFCDPGILLTMAFNPPICQPPVPAVRNPNTTAYYSSTLSGAPSRAWKPHSDPSCSGRLRCDWSSWRDGWRAAKSLRGAQTGTVCVIWGYLPVCWR